MEPSISDTPAGRQFDGWLKVFNSGDRSAILAYHENSFPYKEGNNNLANIDNEMRIRNSSGGFDFQNFKGSAGNSFSAVLKSRSFDRFAEAVIAVTDADPHRVVRFSLRPIQTPYEFLPLHEREEVHRARSVDGSKRAWLIDQIAREIDIHYIFPDVGKRMIEALRTHEARGDYDTINEASDFAETVTRDLREVGHDLQMSVLFERTVGRKEADKMNGKNKMENARYQKTNWGFGEIRRLEGNVASLTIYEFPSAKQDGAREAIAGFMTEVADAEALLIDLRESNGGYSDSAALVASYIFDKTPVKLNEMFWKDNGGSTEEFWTQPDVKGTRFGLEKPVYVLTSKYTSSSGEEFAYNLQCLHRATVVGEPTAGAAHVAPFKELDDWFAITVPTGRPINPITKTNWEGVGVLPDVQVPAEEALEEAHKRALDSRSR